MAKRKKTNYDPQNNTQKTKYCLNIIVISVLHLIIQVGVVKYYCYHECITLNYTGSCS
jgi:hypothetical protein